VPVRKPVALREYAPRWSEAILDEATDAVVGADLQDRITLWNPAAQRLFGYSAGEAAGRLAAQLLATGPADARAARASARGKRMAPFDAVWTAKDGRAVPVSVSVSPVRNDEGALIGIARVARDVGDRLRAEEALRESEAELRAVFELGSGGQAHGDPATGRLLRINQTLCALLGYTESELLRLTFMDVTHPDDLAGDVEQFARLLRGEIGQYTVDKRLVCKDGSLKWVQVTATAIRDTSGNIVRTAAAGVDITARKEQEQELRRQVRLNDALFNQAITNFALFDADFRFIRVNAAYARHYRRPVSDFPGRQFFELFPYDYSPENARILQSVGYDGETFQGTSVRYEFADLPGRPVAYFDMLIQPIFGEDGQIEFVFFSSIDATERTLAHDRLRASLTEKEVMLREIHHRVKNNLQFISSLLSLQAARVTDPRVAQALAESQNRIRTVALVHENLYRTPDLASIPMASHLESLCAYLFRSFAVDAERILLELELAPLVLDVDQSIRCGLIVNELVSNAVKHAFPDGRRGRIVVRLAEQAGEYALSVIDDGIGISTEIDLAHATSLGLQLVSDLTENLGGTLSLARNSGTTFTVTFRPSLGGATA
jgi:PAS domain S-box-containing protein